MTDEDAHVKLHEAMGKRGVGDGNDSSPATVDAEGHEHHAEMMSYIDIISRGAPRTAWRVMLRAFCFPNTHFMMEKCIGRDPKPSLLNVDWLDGLSLLMIVVNTILTATAQPLFPNSSYMVALMHVDWAFTFFFLLEMIIRLSSFGLIIFRADHWNVFDAFIILTSVVSTVMEMLQFTTFSLTTLRTIRVLRPLRSLRLIESARLMIIATIRAAQSLLDVGLLFVLFLIIFGVSGVSQFSSRFRTRCVNSDFYNPNVSALVNETFHGSYNRDIQQFVRFAQYDADVRKEGLRLVEEYCLRPRRCAALYREAHRQWMWDVPPDLVTFNASGCVMYFPIDTDPLPGPQTHRWPVLRNHTALLDASDEEAMERLSYLPPYFRRVALEFDCLYDSGPVLSLPPLSPSAIHRLSVLEPWPPWSTDLWTDQTCDPTDALLLIGFICPMEYSCAFVHNPFFGIMGFDNLAQSLLTLFTCVTLQLWHQLLYMAVDAVDPTAALYFVAVVILGSFFIVNLAVVLITMEFERCSNEERDRMKKYRGLTRSSIWSSIGAKWDAFIERLSHRVNVEKEVMTVRRLAAAALQSMGVQIAINALILINVIMMATEHYGMDPTHADVIDWFNLAFTIAFTIELLLRLVAEEFTEFIRSVMNLIDVAVIIVSWVDVSSSAYRIPMVRAFRAFRLMNLFKTFPQMYRWITIIVHSLKSSLMLTLMIAFTLFIFAAVGMNLFGGRFCNMNVVDDRGDDSVDSCTNRPRANFDEITAAMITAFIVTTADDWEVVMFNGIRARGEMFSLIFVFFFVVSNYIQINLLIGILLSVRADAEAVEEDEEGDVADGCLLDGDVAGKQWLKTLTPHFSKLQLSIQEKVEGNAFRFSIVFIIFLSSICLALESPIGAPNTTSEQVLRWVDGGCSIIFLLEVLLLMCAYGVIQNPWCYLRRDWWNVFDFILVCLTVSGWIMALVHKGDNTSNALRALRVLRAIRPFRFINRSSGMKLVISTLTQSLKPLGNLLIVIVIVFLMWGVMGVQLFKGTFYSCAEEGFTSRTACEENGHEWENAPLHFDHLPAALLSLFTVATLEGWAEIMWNAVDAVGPDQAPIVNYRVRNSLYFVTFVIIGGFFFVNLFVSIIIDAYQKASLRDGALRARFLTPGQTAWIRSQHVLVSQIPVIDYDIVNEDSAVSNCIHRAQRIMRRVVRDPLFEVLIYCCIMVNFMVMAIDQYPKSATMEIFIMITHVTFAVVFAVEAMMKIFAESWPNYIASKWNRFDFAITVLSFLAVIMEFVFSNASFAATFRTMRTLRLLRLVRTSRRLQGVLKKFLFALYSLKNVTAVLLLLIFSFAVMGMKLFGRVQRNQHITHRANFENIINSMLMLMRVSTGANWKSIMSACSIEPPDCELRIDECGLNVVAQLYFVVFLLLSMFIMINLFVAVILESYSQLADELEIISNWDAAQLLKLWFHFDPERTFRMESRFLLTFLRAIPASCPLGMGEIPKRRRLQHEFVFVESLRLKENGGLIELQDLIYALCHRAYREQLPEKRRRLLVRKTDRKFRREDRDRFKPAAESFDVAHRFTVMLLEAYWERRKLVQARRLKFRTIRRLHSSEGEGVVDREAVPAKTAEAIKAKMGGPNVHANQSPVLPRQSVRSTSAATRTEGKGISQPQSSVALPSPGDSFSCPAGDVVPREWRGEAPANELPGITVAEAVAQLQHIGRNQVQEASHTPVISAAGASTGQHSSAVWTVRDHVQSQTDRGGVGSTPSLADLILEVEGYERMSAADLLDVVVRKLRSGHARPVTQEELVEIAKTIRQVKQLEDELRRVADSQREKLLAEEAERRTALVSEWEQHVLGTLQREADHLDVQAAQEAEDFL